MERRFFLLGTGGLAAGLFRLPALQANPPLEPVSEPHFPDRLHRFVWRNWELVNLDRMAEVVGCRPGDLAEIGTAMGLPPKAQITPDQFRRIYITVIRQNWHLLPDEQLIRLLGWTTERLGVTLREDDFLDQKLGPKPVCARVDYAPPGAEARQRAAEIRQTLDRHLGRELAREGEPAFTFVRRLSDLNWPSLRDPEALRQAEQVDLSGWEVRGGEGLDARIVQRFNDYLRQAMGAKEGRAGGKAIHLLVDPAIKGRGERFTVAVDDDRVEVTGDGVTALLQAVYWLQDRMEEDGGPFLRRGRTERRAEFNPRYLYPYFALYGDPLLEPTIDPFPDGYLEKLGKAGINGVWMQCVLNTLAPSQTFPEFGRGWETRLANLDKLVQRAKRFGLRLYLYVNEPRAQPAEFFRTRPEMRGAGQNQVYALCTAVPAVREWIADSLAHVVRHVPDLGGVFSITMSENLTNCFSHGTSRTCPRCSQREDWQAVGEVLEAIHRGVRRSGREAEVIVWDWGWPEPMAKRLIPTLPRDVRFQSVSEWSIPIRRGGVATTVGEYSISVVGPGPRATAHWELARQAGVSTLAKAQFNNTWEISAVPYIPVAHLIARHCANLGKVGVQGVMCSWTLGGYPSPNLEIAKEIGLAPGDRVEDALERVARRRYGRSAAPLVLDAWKGFSEAFEEFPYGVNIYCIPTQHGPANLLRPRPTGMKCGMILFPWDDYKEWCGAYPPTVVRDQFARLADRWEDALPVFRKAVARVPAWKKSQADLDLAIAETCAIHFRSVANQVEFYLLRDGDRKDGDRQRMRALIAGELELARRLYTLARHHSVIAYEASNHYYYRPLDLAEKIVHCQYLLDSGLNA
ncbi:MAG: hypothetical protein ACHRXM_31200 [Isosphaerales bacterium]